MFISLNIKISEKIQFQYCELRECELLEYRNLIGKFLHRHIKFGLFPFIVSSERSECGARNPIRIGFRVFLNTQRKSSTNTTSCISMMCFCAAAIQHQLLKTIKYFNQPKKKKKLLLRLHFSCHYNKSFSCLKTKYSK
jgi:hypothetical protein